jgi:23S rRNA pseudouridine2605 synthase
MGGSSLFLKRCASLSACFRAGAGPGAVGGRRARTGTEDVDARAESRGFCQGGEQPRRNHAGRGVHPPELWTASRVTGHPRGVAGRPPGTAGRPPSQEARAQGGPRTRPAGAGAAPTRPQARRLHGRAAGVAPRGRGRERRAPRQPVRRGERRRQETPSRTDDAREAGRPAPAQPRRPQRASSRVMDGSPRGRAHPRRRGPAPGCDGTGVAPGSACARRATGGNGEPEASPTRPQARKVHGRAAGVAPRGCGRSRRAPRRPNPSTNPKGAHINSGTSADPIAAGPRLLVRLYGLALSTAYAALDTCLRRGSHDEGPAAPRELTCSALVRN